MKKKTIKTIQIGFLFGLLMLALSAMLPYHNFQLLRNSEQWVDHTMQVLQATDALRIAITDAESGQRGFLLTQNSQYLNPYNESRKKISTILNSLVSLTNDSPTQQKYLKKINNLTMLKFDELQLTIDLQTQSKRDEALAVVTTDQGNNLMQEIRILLNQFQTTEEQFLHDRIQETYSHHQHTLYSFLFISFLNFLLFSGLYFLIVKNIRIRHAAEVESNQQANLLASIINTMNEGVYVINAEGHTLVSNPALIKIYGQDVVNTPPENWLNQFNISHVDGSSLEFNELPIVKVLNDRSDSAAEIVIRPTATENPKIVKINAKPLLNSIGAPAGVVCISIDISAEKKAELKLRLAMQEAEIASKAKSEFLANMSHEIRTPMNAVLGMTYLLSTTTLNDDQMKYVDMITASGKLLLGLINDILDFSKIEAGKMDLSPTEFQFKELINSAATLMTINAGHKDLELVIDVDPAIPSSLYGDINRLQQILINLIGNAIKFTEQGKVCLSAFLAKQLSDEVEITFIVKDTGIGMTPIQIGKLFKEFSQADASTTRRFGGTGLGLVICRRLIELMEGNIFVTSKEGEGTEFKLIIPLKVPAAPNYTDLNTSLSEINVLLIDGHIDTSTAIARTLKSWNWKLNTATTINEAFDLIKNTKGHKPDFDVVLLDWRLAGKDITDLLQDLNALLKEKTPIVLLGNAFGHDGVSSLLTQGLVNGILLKPITPSHLYDLLHELLAPNQITTQEIKRKQAKSFDMQNVKILLADDNNFNQIVARGILEQAKISVDTVDNGKAAIEILEMHPAVYDLVLMDVHMPIMDGFAATQYIRHTLGLNIPILALSAGVMADEKERCFQAGMNDFIAKPINVNELFQTLKKFLPKDKTTTTHVETQSAESSESTHKKSDIFDPGQLLKIVSHDPDQHKKIDLMIINLLKSTQEKFAKTQIFIKEEEYKEAAILLHTMRGSLGMLGTQIFSTAALELEQILNSKDLSNLDQHIDQVVVALDDVIEAAKKWLNSKTL